MNDLEIFNRIRKTIRTYDMISSGDKVLVCVSGGPDSVFLTHFFLYLRNSFKLDLSIAHLEHGLRGRASYEDMLFVRDLARKHKISFFCKRIKLKRQKGYSTEETARARRYAFFQDVAGKHCIRKIATAHTADDQAETILMRLIKGTSIKGLTGIPPVRRTGFFLFVRPLLEIEKTDILHFMKKKKLGFRIDHTNLDNRFLRNSVRNRIIPYLKRYNPRIKRAVFNLAESLREDREFIENAKQGLLRRVNKQDGNVCIALKDVVVQPAAIQKEVIRDSLMMAGGNVKKFTFRHWKDIRSLITSQPRGKSLHLPGNITLSKKGHDLIFTKHVMPDR